MKKKTKRKEIIERMMNILDSITEEEFEKEVPSVIAVLTTEQLEKADKNDEFNLLVITFILIEKLMCVDYSKKFIEDLHEDVLLKVCKRYMDKFFR